MVYPIKEMVVDLVKFCLGKKSNPKFINDELYIGYKSQYPVKIKVYPFKNFTKNENLGIVAIGVPQ